MFNVYQQHKGSNISMPQEKSLEGVKRLAEAAAKLGHDAFYRAFRVTPNGESFVTAFSVLEGTVAEHNSVTFPQAHF